MKRLLLLVVALIVYGSLFPWQFDWSRGSAGSLGVMLHNWPVRLDPFVLRDVAINVLLYVPLGITAFLAVSRRHSPPFAIAGAMLMGVGLSTGMEILQVFVPGRDSSIFDVFTNSAGTLAGVVAALLLRPRFDRWTAHRPHSHAKAALLLLACWGTCQLYPFFPALSHAALRRSLSALTHGPALSMAEVWAVAAEWFAFFLAIRAVVGQMRWWWPAGALVILAARLVTVSRVLTASEAAGTALALLLWLVIAEKRRMPAGACMMAVALVLRELAPFHFSAAAQPFSWIPFVPTFVSEWQSAIVILARKAFDYGALLWLLRKCGFHYGRTSLPVAAALFGFEWLQVYLPGRTPEITDAVLALLMSLSLWFCEAGASASALVGQAFPPAK